MQLNRPGDSAIFHLDIKLNGVFKPVIIELGMNQPAKLRLLEKRETLSFEYGDILHVLPI